MIKNILLVGAGGALGSIARYTVTLLFTYFAICSEWAILAINIIGSFLIGLLFPMQGNCGYLFMAVGFCGGFTTFSTFSAQALNLFQTGQRTIAILYIAASISMSIISVLLGIYCADKLIK